MNKSVSVSIVMGVYNPRSPKRFFQALESIQRQSFSDWELLVYDDGSAEPYQRLIRRAGSLDGRIRCLRGGENRGLAHALNVCIRQAAGRFIARMDDDDLAKPDRLEKQVAFLEAHPQYQWVGSNAELMDDQGVWGFQKMPEIPQTRDYLYNSPFIHPSVMFRRDVLILCGGYDESRQYLLCEDYELFMRLHHRGNRGYNLQDPLLQYWESYESYRKRTFRRRLREMRLRYRGFRDMGLLETSTFPYVLKPLLTGSIPAPVHHYINRRLKRTDKTM